jgi:hypothetical protein
MGSRFDDRFIEYSQVVTSDNYNTLNWFTHSKGYYNYKAQYKIVNVCLLVVAW